MYYDKHNPHMRALNAHGEWRSDWDPTTRLLYVVRKHYFEDQTIPPFDPADEPVDEKHTRGGVTRTYPTLCMSSKRKQRPPSNESKGLDARMKRMKSGLPPYQVSSEGNSADWRGVWSDEQERLRKAVRSLERELVCIKCAADIVTAIDQLTADESGFLHNRNWLLDAWRKGDLFTMRIKETDELYKDHVLRDALGHFLGVSPSWLNLPVLCWRDGDACEILWVAKHVRRLGLGRDLVRSLGIKRAAHVLDQSIGFWERIGVSIEGSVS